MTPEEREQVAEHACRVVAARVLAVMAGDRDELWEIWEAYPEVAEHDWKRVVDHISLLGHEHDVQQPYFAASYDILAARAEVDA